MTKKEAGQKLKATLGACSNEQFADVRVMMEVGAGLMGLPDGAVMTGPEDLASGRRDVYANLIDAVYDCDPDSGTQDWTPVRGGAWEDVTATLVIEEDWKTIARTAKELRDEETDEQKEFRRQFHERKL